MTQTKAIKSAGAVGAKLVGAALLAFIALLPFCLTTTRAQINPSASTELIGSLYLEKARPYLDFIAKSLFKTVDGSNGIKALSETEKPIQGDAWYWTDDNAKALEAFILPAAYEHYKSLADSLTKFVRDMSSTPLIYRRVAAPVLVIDKFDVDNFRLHNGLLEVFGNLRSDEINVSYRFHDGRTANAMRLGGNWVDFVVNGKKRKFFVRDDISEARVEKRENSAVLHYSAVLSTGGLFFAKSPVARVTYGYVIDANSTYIMLDLEIEPLNGATLANVHITSSMDQLSSLDRSVSYAHFCWGNSDTSKCVDRSADHSPG